MPTVTSANREEFNDAEMAKKNGKPNFDEMDEEFSKSNNSDYIQHHAEKFATNLKKSGFDVDLHHSGSKLGASSYAKVFDPQTGRFIVDPIRFSGHSKGVQQNELINNVFKPSESDHFIKMAHEMRALGPSKHLQLSKEQEERILRLRAKNEEKKLKQTNRNSK
jgi:hypothetical protein